jgi:hypothetical protein
MMMTGAGDLHASYLERALELIESIDEPLYTRTSRLLPGGTVGKHLRHCLDLYDCFLGGLPDGEIDYTLRERDPEAEIRIESGLRRLRKTIRRMEGLNARADRILLVKGEGAFEEGPDAGFSLSSVGRELDFILSHTIHHFALIGVLLRSGGAEIPSDLETAPSTRRHRERGSGVPADVSWISS